MKALDFKIIEMDISKWISVLGPSFAKLLAVTAQIA